MSYIICRGKLLSHDGYSLVELMIVVAIIGIVGTYAKFNYSAANSRLNQAARDLYSNMQKARMEAIKRNEPWALICDNTTNSYAVCAFDTVADICVGSNTTISLTQGYSSEIQFGNGNATTAISGAFPADGVSYSNNSAYFDSRGLSPKRGYIYLQNNINTSFAVGTSSLAGVVKLRKWNGTSWD